MADLVKELKNKAVQQRAVMTELSAVTEATRLIAQGGAEDMNILREMGMHESVEHAMNLEGSRIELEKFEKEYGAVYTREEIKGVACKYALKFLRSSNYKGKVPPELVTKVKDFFRDSKIDMNDAKLGYNMYVLAPYKDFQLIDRPIPEKYVDPEPMLFYKLDDSHYRLIHKWGTDLTLWNRILGIKNGHWTGYWAFWSTKIFLLYGPLLMLLLYKFRLAHISEFWQIPVWVGLALSVLVGLGKAVGTEEGDRNKYLFRPWSEEWNTNEKPVR